MDNVQFLKAGTNSAVGNGKSTSFWSHSWAYDKPLAQLVLTEIPLKLLPNEALQTIASFELVQDDDSPDTYFWNASPCGTFTVKSTMEMIRSDSNSDTRINWKLPWRIPAPQKVRLFVWLVLQDRILSNSNRLKRGLADNARCSACGHLEETTLHILRECPKAKRIWLMIHSSLPSSDSFSLPLEDWIMDNITCSSSFGIENWDTLFALTIWWTWRWRNCRVFDKESEIPGNPLGFLLKRLQETVAAIARNESLFKQQSALRKEVFVRWAPPPYGWFVLNIDGASRGNPGSSGAGGIIRDDAGCFRRAFALKLGISTSMKAEIIAFARGLMMANDLHIPKLLIQTDSLMLVEMLQRKESLLSRPYLLKACRELMEGHQWQVVIQHIYREANSSADWLANVAIDQEERLTVFEYPPDCLKYLLRQDISGVSWPRWVPHTAT
ncbi:hypothetical protein vseg_011353 [Gypsophila vaccaria]